jgi:hypothetical protein
VNKEEWKNNHKTLRTKQQEWEERIKQCEGMNRGEMVTKIWQSTSIRQDRKPIINHYGRRSRNRKAEAGK